MTPPSTRRLIRSLRKQRRTQTQDDNRCSIHAAQVTTTFMRQEFQSGMRMDACAMVGYTAAMNSKLLLLLLLAALPAASFAQTTPVIALQNLAHTAESLDKTVPFYRDVIGLPVNGARDPLAQQPQALDEDMSKFT